VSFVAPTKSRIDISLEGQWTKITVPAVGSWHTRIFLIFWLVLATMMVGGMLNGLVDGTHTEPAVVRAIGAIFMSVFFIFGLVGLVWNLAGQEIIWVSANRIARSSAIGPLKKTSEFDKNAIRKAFWLLSSSSEGAPLERGAVKISYGGKDVSLASGLDKTEAENVLNTLTHVAGIPQA